MRRGCVKYGVLILLLVLAAGASGAPSGSEVQFIDITEGSKVDFSQQNSATSNKYLLETMSG